MESKITEVAPDVYRISTFADQYGIQMNQYLVKDDEPFLMHTMSRGMFPATSRAVASLIDPATLRWIGPAGALRPVPLLADLCRRPARIPALWRLGRRSRVAVEKLADAVEQIARAWQGCRGGSISPNPSTYTSPGRT